MRLNGPATRRILASRGIWVTEAAEAAGVARSNLSNILAGRRATPPGLIERLAEYLGVPPIALVEDPLGAVTELARLYGIDDEDPRAAVAELARLHGLTVDEGRHKRKASA